MQIEVTMDTGGAAAAGVDRAALVANIQAELDKFTAATKAPGAVPKDHPAPAGAQGDLSAIQWIIDIATDPVMAKAYASALVYAINSIITAGTAKQSDDKANMNDKDSAPVEKPVVKVSLFGKVLALPLATSAIKKLLESIEG